MQIELLPVEDSVAESPEISGFVKPEGAPMAPFVIGRGSIDYLAAIVDSRWRKSS